MVLQSGELYTLATDPLLILMARECETVEDEYDLAHIADERDTVLLAAQQYTAMRTSQSN